MAQCAVCGKQRVVGNNVSHANNRTKRLTMPNLQKMRVIMNKRQKTLRMYQMSAFRGG